MTRDQYHELKRQHPETLLLVRVGDFYESYEDDAQAAHDLLGLTIGQRNGTWSNVPMAGFPYHQLDNYLRRLVASGKRVAVCEQVVKVPHDADVERIVTPGRIDK